MAHPRPMARGCVCPQQAPPRKDVCARRRAAAPRGCVCSPQAPPREGVCARRRRRPARVCVLAAGAAPGGCVCSPQAPPREVVCARRRCRPGRESMCARRRAAAPRGCRRRRRPARVCVLAAGAAPRGCVCSLQGGRPARMCVLAAGAAPREYVCSPQCSLQTPPHEGVCPCRVRRARMCARRRRAASRFGSVIRPRQILAAFVCPVRIECNMLIKISDAQKISEYRKADTHAQTFVNKRVECCTTLTSL